MYSRRLKFVWDKCCIVPISCLLYTFWSSNLSNPALIFSEISAQLKVMIAFRAICNLFCSSEDATKIKFMNLNRKLMHLSSTSWNSLYPYLPMGYQFKNYFLNHATTVKKKKGESKSWTAIKSLKKQVGLFYSYIKNNLLSQNNVQLEEAVQTILNRAGKCLKKN